MIVRVSRRHSANEIVLFLTHVFDESTAAEYERLVSDCEGYCDTGLLYDARASYDTIDPSRVSGAVGYDLEGDLCTLRHFADPGITSPAAGNMDVPVLEYARRQSGYSHYWVIEFDVRFTGRWTDLFQAFRRSPADLLTTSLHDYAYHPNWAWWKTLQTPPEVSLAPSDLIRAFLPIYRISRRALRELPEAYRSGWRGYHEVTMGTILKYAGLTLEDIGGDGPLVRWRNRNRFYRNDPRTEPLSPGTFVWRPVREQPGDRWRTLYHPIKRRSAQRIQYGVESSAEAE